MPQSYQVTKRGPQGEPVEISCVAHPSCTWRLATAGPRKDDDPILVAMVGAHLRELSVPDRQASGHERRRRGR